MYTCTFIVFMVYGISGVVGVYHHWVLVHRATRERSTVPYLGIWRKTKLLLDDRVLQPSGISNSNETGGIIM